MSGASLGVVTQEPHLSLGARRDGLALGDRDPHRLVELVHAEVQTLVAGANRDQLPRLIGRNEQRAMKLPQDLDERGTVAKPASLQPCGTPSTARSVHLLALERERPGRDFLGPQEYHQCDAQLVDRASSRLPGGFSEILTTLLVPAANVFSRPADDDRPPLPPTFFFTDIVSLRGQVCPATPLHATLTRAVVPQILSAMDRGGGVGGAVAVAAPAPELELCPESPPQVPVIV